MKMFYHQSRQETLAYIGLWAVLFALPLLGLLVHANANNIEVNLRDGFRIWVPLLAIFICFVIHNYIIAPQLIYEHRKWVYATLLIVLFGGFLLFQHLHRPSDLPPMPKDKPLTEMHSDDKPHFAPHHRPPHKHIVDDHKLVSLFMLILALGTNLGIKIYFKSRDDRLHLENIEREHLTQELEYLKYQVNPHFFMNTLNNIHALVDIEPGQAKRCIIDLSRLMRYMLYEGAKPSVSLMQVIENIQHHLDLMRIRYDDKVDIQYDFPTDVPAVDIPPLLLIPFVENAFKHGVSYSKPSFIHISIVLEGATFVFTCRNSKNNTKHEPGGLGLSNVVKRLDLLFPEQYKIEINDTDDTYFVKLQIPTQTQQAI